MADSSRPRIGILGGGQLGLYLCQAARRMGLHSTVLDPTADCPAARTADRVLVAGFDDLDAAAELAASCDALTFEIETISPAVLDFLADAQAQADGPTVAPDPSILRLLQHKGEQKRWLAAQDFATAPFRLTEDATAEPRRWADELGLPLVQKSLTGGYDGRGVQILRTGEALDGLWDGASLLEAFVHHDQELAVVTARSADGSQVSYPPVGLRFLPGGNVLDLALAPAAIPEPTARRAVALAEAVVDALGGVGVFAVELFLAADGEVLVNELSPRVHNSGHHTLEACAVSQFEQHLRAVAGLPLQPVAPARPAVMKNLLYDDALAPLCRLYACDLSLRPDDVHLHWYGKSQGTPLRKMGHLTVLGDDLDAARRRLDEAQQVLVTLLRAVEP